MKNFFWIKTVVIVVVAGFVGAGIALKVVFYGGWFPVPTRYSEETSTGVSMNVATYHVNGLSSSWWDGGPRMSIIKIRDEKNDSPVYRVTLPYTSVPASVHLIHSGEKLAVVVAGNMLYLLHRSPRAVGGDSLEKIAVSGVVFAVALDETGYFSYEQGGGRFQLVKYDWSGKKLLGVTAPISVHEIDQQVVSPDGSKIAFMQASDLDTPPVVFIWDLKDDAVANVPIATKKQNVWGGELRFGDDGHLYMGIQQAVEDKLVKIF